MPPKGGNNKTAIPPGPSGKKGGPSGEEEPSSKRSDLKLKNFEPGENQIKRGMLIWTGNPNSTHLHRFAKIQSISSNFRKMKRTKHFELVLEVNTEGNYVTTVMLTSLNNAVSLEAANVRKENWKYLIPQSPKTVESGGEQAFEASFKSAVSMSQSGGWFNVSAPSYISPDTKTGKYQAVETEMSNEMLERLLDLAKGNEQAFNEYVENAEKRKHDQEDQETGGSHQSTATGSGLRGKGKGKEPPQGPAAGGGQSSGR